MTKLYVFLLGTPGCGKSHLFRGLEKRIGEVGLAASYIRVDDFPKLWACFMDDDAREKHGEERRYSRPTDDGGYKVTNDAVWNDILKELNKDLAERDEDVVYVEFARNNYIEAMKNFDQQYLAKGLAIYFDVPFEVCWERNVARHEAALEAGTDDHLVSREEMEETYGTDDHEAFLAAGILPSISIPTADEGLEEVFAKVKELLGEA